MALNAPRSTVRGLVLIFGLLLVDAGTVRAQFALVDGDGTSARVYVGPGEPDYVRLAAEDLVDDVEKITGRKLAVVSVIDACSPRCVVLASVSVDASRRLLSDLAPSWIPELEGKWEAYRAASVAGGTASNLVIAGSDARGTMFGLYRFIEDYLGVDPLYFWTEREPEPRQTLSWDRVDLAAGEPTFRFRGWFLNDEDLLVDWTEGGGQRFISYMHYHDVTSRDIHERVFESLLRLGMNLVIPASFNDVANPNEARAIELAAKRGLFVSMHHVEPMGVSGYAYQNYWSRKGAGKSYSIVEHPEAFEEVWRYYAGLWAQYPNVVWQLGLRGIADRPVWVSDPNAPKTDEARGKMISDAIATQWEIVKEVESTETPLATTTLWMEGADLHRKGFLTFPAGIAVIFADNSPGWSWQEDFYDVPRTPGRDYGVYYHHQLWGFGPHLAQAVPVGKTHALMGEAVQSGDTYYAILNVGNVREFVLGLAASAEMLRDFEGFDENAFIEEWTAERFDAAAVPAAQAYRRYFDSYVEAEVEYQGEQQLLPKWLDGRTQSRGKQLFARLLARVAVPSAETALHARDDLEEWLKEVVNQRRGLEQAGALAGQAASLLGGSEKRFIEANLMAQQQIMLGLTRWAEAGIRATLAEHRGDREAVRYHVQEGVDGVEQVRAGQALAARGRFENWYRGDRKMNLGEAEVVTRELLKALAHQRKGTE